MKKLIFGLVAILLLAGCAGIDAELDKAKGIAPLQTGKLTFPDKTEIALEAFEAVGGPQHGCLYKLTLKNNSAQPIMPTVIITALQNKQPVSEIRVFFPTTNPQGQSLLTETMGLPFSASCTNIELKARIQDELNQ